MVELDIEFDSFIDDPLDYEFVYTTSSTFRKTKPVIPSFDDVFTVPNISPPEGPEHSTKPIELDLYVEIFRVGLITNVRFLAKILGYGI